MANHGKMLGLNKGLTNKNNPIDELRGSGLTLSSGIRLIQQIAVYEKKADRQRLVLNWGC